MKKCIILSLLLVFATASFSQQIVQKQTLTKADYQQKSKKQKKTGLILLAGGAGLIITSLVIPQGELVYDGICFVIYCTDKYKNDGLVSGFFIAGGLAALTSIPFFIASSKNKKRANVLSAFLKMEKTPVLRRSMSSSQAFPVISVKISL